MLTKLLAAYINFTTDLNKIGLIYSWKEIFNKLSCYQSKLVKSLAVVNGQHLVETTISLVEQRFHSKERTHADSS